LKSDFAAHPAAGVDDLLEEYDSEETVDSIAGVLRAAGHEPVKMGGGRRFLERVLEAPRAIDLVFNIAEGFGSRSREAHVPAVCEMLGIPYTHSDPLTLALSLDKAMAKRIVASHGVPTPPFLCVESVSGLDSASLPPFPSIAKPACEGSSMGIRNHSRCDRREELEAQVAGLLASYSGPVIVEQFLTGVEVTVGIVGSGAQARILGAMEIAPRNTATEDFIYSVEVKRAYRNEVEYHAPPRLPAEAIESVARTALAAYRALGCRDVGRVDLRLNSKGVPCFLELNPLPGLHPVSGDLPILCGRLGISYDTLIATITEAAIQRACRG
jgi:D-alanine-D-alanine ligase